MQGLKEIGLDTSVAEAATKFVKVVRETSTTIEDQRIKEVLQKITFQDFNIIEFSRSLKTAANAKAMDREGFGNLGIALGMAGVAVSEYAVNKTDLKAKKCIDSINGATAAVKETARLLYTTHPV